MTLDSLEIDIGPNIFAAGQAYTAISRAQSLKSIKIKALAKSSFIIKDSVLEFYKKIEDDIVIKNNKYVQSILDKLIENLNNEIDVDNTLTFIWEFVSGDDAETMKYFEEFELDDTLISKLENIRKYMLADLELVNNKLNECKIIV